MQSFLPDEANLRLQIGLPDGAAAAGGESGVVMDEAVVDRPERWLPELEGFKGFEAAERVVQIGLGRQQQGDIGHQQFRSLSNLLIGSFVIPSEAEGRGIRGLFRT